MLGIGYGSLKGRLYQDRLKKGQTAIALINSTNVTITPPG
jgi:hypothetical protein